ncbi:MAG: hypothetical protein K2N58_10850 [Treponemataceae bacterium]|nr:hypothetical protein [Treponemataceae bacterium]
MKKATQFCVAFFGARSDENASFRRAFFTVKNIEILYTFKNLKESKNAAIRNADFNRN